MKKTFRILKFKKEFKFSFNKLFYYDAVAAIYKNNLSLARNNLRPIIFSHIIYFLIRYTLFYYHNNYQYYSH